jgi:C-terminal peptidase prc
VDGRRQTVLQHLRRLAGGAAADEASDRQLLERFAAGHDEDAFAALVRRHGPLVWGACRRRLRHVQDAEDCFQATFLVLARKAGSVRWHDSVAGWLHAVASRVAAETRARNARRRAHERTGLAPAEDPPAPEPAGRELCTLLDEELRGLPDRYRAPLLLCYLEGRTTDQAARQLGWSLRTLERRLAEGRERLRSRLTRRGLTLSGVLLTAALSEGAGRGALPAGLADATTRAAVSLPAGTSPAVVALVETTLKGMTMTRARLVTAAFVLLTATAGVGLLLGNPPRHAGDGPASAPAAKDTPGKPADAPVAGDLAARVWGILEVVRQNHLEPPPRGDMILAAAKGLVKAAKATPPDDLARRAADVASEEQLRAFLREIAPARTGAADAKTEAALLEGLFDSIPGKPALLSADELRRADQLSGNRYVGIGIQIAPYEPEKVTQIRNPFPRGTARKAGVKPNDLLLEVDGKSTKGVDLQQVVKWVQGPKGTPVTIVVRQPDASEKRTLKVLRDVIPIDSVLGYRRAGEDRWDYRADPEAGVGYVWVPSIKSSTLHELRQVERRLQAEGARALVLDLRFSQGEGVLDHAALVADGLLDGGLMWRVRHGGADAQESRADRECLFRGWPLAVLVNGITDNAQGAVLAALQDNHRATLVGEPTKGDGSVRKIFHLPGGQDGLTVLTGRLERAAPGRGWPVVPDRGIDLTKEQRSAVERWLGAKQLPEPPAGTDGRPPDDPQLAAAVALLRDAVKGAAPGGRK